MITLYHAPRSRSSRIIWLLEELGEPYKIALTSILRADGQGAPAPDSYTRIHPLKKVPEDSYARACDTLNQIIEIGG